MFKRQKHNRGDISVMMILTILMSMLMIGTATATITFKSLRAARVSNDAAESYYLAEASLERKLVELKFTMGVNSIDRQCIVDCAAYSIINDGAVHPGTPNFNPTCQCQSTPAVAPQLGETSYFGDTGRGEHFIWSIRGQGDVNTGKIIPILRVDGGNYRVRRGIKAVINLPSRCPPLDVVIVMSGDVPNTEPIVSPINPRLAEPITRTPPTWGTTITRPSFIEWKQGEEVPVTTVNQGISAIVQKIIDNFNFANNRLLLVSQAQWSLMDCQGYGTGCQFLGYDPAEAASQQNPFHQITEENITLMREFVDGTDRQLGTHDGAGTHSGAGANLDETLFDIFSHATNYPRVYDQYGQEVHKVVIRIDDGSLNRLPANLSPTPSHTNAASCQQEATEFAGWRQVMTSYNVDAFWIKVGSSSDIEINCHPDPIATNWYGPEKMINGDGVILNYDRCHTDNIDTGDCDEWVDSETALDHVYEVIENSIHSSCTI